MTKIKNTKKGMAKKTLSMSLVVAMLATSNVPVWAAEFSDGTDAAAVASEADTFSTDAEAPVVEDNATDATDAQSTGDTWNVTLKDMPKDDVEWGSVATNVTVEVKDVDGKLVVGTDKDGNPVATSELKYVWKDASTGLAVTEATPVSRTIATPATVYAKKDSVGKQYVLYIYDESGDWSYTSSALTVSAKDVTGKYEITINKNNTYTGTETKPAATVSPIAGKGGDADVQFDVDYTGDLVNVTDEGIKVTAKPVDSKAYKGYIETTIKVTASDLKDEATKKDEEKLVKAALKTKEVEYTGSEIKLKKADVNVTDAKTGADLNALVDDKAEISTGLTNVTEKDADAKNVTVDLTANKSVANFSGTGKVTTTDKVKVVARDLSKVKVTIKSQAKLGDGKAYTLKDLLDKGAISFADTNGKTLTLDKDIAIEGLDKAVNYGTYTVTIKPAKDNKNVTGQTTAQFSIFSQNIEGAKFYTKTKKADGSVELKEYKFDDYAYTGEQIKPDVSKLVVAFDKNNEVDPADYSIEYDKNVNAGTGNIYIVGKRTYEGSKTVATFNIKAATVSSVDAPKYVIVNKDAKKASDYAKDIKLTVKAKNSATPAKEFTLADSDYSVDYKFCDGDTDAANEITDLTKVTPGNYFVKATITVKNANYTKDAKKVVYIRVAQPILKDSDIKLKKTSYEYTGAVIVPDFDVVVDGKTLKRDTDYVIKNVVDSAKAGTATVYITGKGEYDAKVSAKATFEVTSVNADKVVVTLSDPKSYVYNGKAQKPAKNEIEKITLNGNDVTNQFDITSYGENINAGKGTFVLTPNKNNKGFTTGSTKNVEFEIQKATLKGSIKVYDARGIDITNSLPSFDYDGTEKTFAKVVFTPDVKTPVTTDDYEIKYVNNVTGNGDDENNDKKGASVVVVAKGNYKVDKSIVKDYSTKPATEVENVVDKKRFAINSKLYFADKEVSVTDAEYAGTHMLAVPTIVVKDGAKTLKEGTDYTVKLYKDEKHTDEIKDGVNEIGTYYYVVSGAGVYKDAKAEGKNHAEGEWKVTKKKVANLDVKVDLNEKGETVLTVMNGNLKVDNKEFTVTLSEDKKTATVTATTGNKYYVGSKEVTVGGEVAKVGTPVISGVKVVGNKATVILSGEADGASGYDYVISKANNTTTDRVDITKNQVKTTGDFSYVQQGTYYAYCHAWKRNAEGKKVFSGWSNIYPFSVSAITPSQPVITSVKASGSTVTVTYTKADNADGYDVVLGTSTKKINGEVRPVEYGTLVKKNVKGNVVTATFKNVKKGTYYAGLHAFNKTSEDGTKVFSQWSNAKKVTVK